ncbi:MAG: type IV secretion system protein [Rickettsiales bacterium]|nr:type IV secretion system protein [Rickettsiales bacterium]
MSHYRFAILLFIGLAIFIQASPAYADYPPPQPPGVCTTNPQYNPATDPVNGIMTSIVNNVRAVLNPIRFQMYNGIITNTGFRAAIGAAVTLYIAVYGALFMLGMVQMTVSDFTQRMVKVSILAILINTSYSWAFFNGVVVEFFESAVDDLIAVSTQISIGGISNPVVGGVSASGTSTPFAILDGAIAKALSAKMAVTLLAIFFTGPYGILIGVLLVIALACFVKTLMTAVWVYLMALVMRTLLFGLAPIFIGCMLFQRTYHLFQGWRNQVVNSCLQPILLFIFFAFFVALMSAALSNVTKTPVCWTESMENMRGTPFYIHFWRFQIPKTQFPQSDSDYENYGGGWSFSGPDGANTTLNMPVFPVDIVAVLVFLILAELASRFNSVVTQIAIDLSGASVNLSSMSSDMKQMFDAGKKGGPDAGGRGGPGVAPAPTQGQGQQAAPTPSSNYAAQAGSMVGARPGSPPSAPPSAGGAAAGAAAGAGSGSGTAGAATAAGGGSAATPASTGAGGQNAGAPPVNVRPTPK